MLFIASKIVWTLAAPGNVLLLLLCLGTVLLWTKWRRLGLSVVSVVAICFFAVAVLPLGTAALYPLEQRFPPQPLPARVDGIIVLGGAVQPMLSASRGLLSLNGAAERLITGVELARRFPEARFVFTGGTAALFDREAKEADAVKPMLTALGLPARRILLEAQSRNTYENALFTRRLVSPRPGQVWVLVTSALHMPRAMGCFRQVGWEVLAYPVDYRTPAGGARWWPPSFGLEGGLEGVNLAAHEWIGLIAYRLAGRTSALLPAPHR